MCRLGERKRLSALATADIKPVELFRRDTPSVIETPNDLQLALKEKSIAGGKFLANRITNELGVIAGIVAIFRGAIIAGIVLLIVAALVGPGGYSIFK